MSKVLILFNLNFIFKPGSVGVLEGGLKLKLVKIYQFYLCKHQLSAYEILHCLILMKNSIEILEPL